jgi:hypothetical protein
MGRPFNEPPVNCRHILPILLAALGPPAAWPADCTVVLNEIMVHPAENEPSLEWVELHNQMAVDMDISGWRLAGGIDFRFDEGSVIPGGGHLVVALSPAALTAAAGVTNVVGPFSGRLGNAGDTVTLRNNNDRIMDRVQYGVKGDWPVAPDGAGPSLAKIDETSSGADPGAWRASREMGGTPGRRNASFSVASHAAVRLDAAWRAAFADPGPEWRTVSFDDSSWDTGTGVFAGGTAGWVPGETRPIAGLFGSGVGADGRSLPAGDADPHYTLVASAHTAAPPPVAATVMAGHPAWLPNDTASMWIGPVSNGAAAVAPGAYRYRTTFDLAGMDPSTARITLHLAADDSITNVTLNGAALGIARSGYATLSPAFAITNGFSAGTNTLELLAVNGGASANPGGIRVRAAGSAAVRAPTNTVLATGPGPLFFRTLFLLTGDVAQAAARLRLVVDDGAVVHLNGVEVLRLNMPAGDISSATPAVTNVGDAAFAGPFAIDAAALVTGTNVLAVGLHQAAGGAADAMFGAELEVSVTNPPAGSIPPLVFNELPCVTNQVFWVEIVNRGSSSVVMSNYVFKRFGDPDREYVIPARTLPPGGFTVLTREDLGYGADPGDALVLYTPGKAAVCDAVVAKRYPRARWPDGSGRWVFPYEETPGSTNRVALRDDVVLNEIMYHPRAPQGPPTNSPEQWIELHNRGAAPVDLTGWRLDVDRETVFRFPAGRAIAAGGFLVVAKDAAHLQARYPAADIVGNFMNRLSNGGELIELFDNAGAPADAAGNPVDAVHYRDAPPWPLQADGLGASLEVRDPRADNSRPEAWAASDDSAKASWQTCTYRGTATVEAASSPTLWKEFVMGLLDDGEVLLDDVSVVESPSGAARQLIQNGSFETGTAAWRIIGNHRRSEVVTDPDNVGNRVLRLVSDGCTEPMHNHAETTLAGGAAVTNGLEYEISFRAKWIAGCNRLHTRLYFNRLARVTEIAAPSQAGTPGSRNSRHVANAGPTFAGLRHEPVVPRDGQGVTVSVEASDPDGIASAVLRYSVNEGPWQAVAMGAAPPAGGVTALSAGIPGQAAGSIIQFYVEAADGEGEVAASPAGGPASRALVEVSDGGGALAGLRTVRVVLTPADTAFLHASTNVMSNGRMPCTVIVDDRTAAYDAGVHLHGSERGRDVTARVGFTVRLPSDQPYRGVHDGFTVDRSGGQSGKGGDNDEILLKHAINKAGLLPGMYDDLCWFFAPRAQEDGSGLLVLAKYGGVFLDSQYEDGGDGEMFKLELIYFPTSTVIPGDAQSHKLPQPDGVLGTDIKDLGGDAEAYRWTLLKENHAARNHYAPMVALARAFSQTGTVLDAQMAALMDVDEWMRAVAFVSLIGASDIYTYGNSHNLMIYFRPEDGRGMALPWDMDYSFVQSTNNVFPGTGSPNTTRLIHRPANLHAYYEHLADLTRVTGDSAYLMRWANHYAGLVGQNWTNVVHWLAGRAAYVRSRLPLATPFAITNGSGNGYGVTNAYTTLSGTAPATVREILVNGVRHPVTWLTATNWTVTVALGAFVNNLALDAVDLRGAVVPAASDSITVTNFGLPAPLPVVLNEWMADNAGPGGCPDPADGQFQDWFELFNPNTNDVDLSGFRLTDDLALPAKWAIPSNTTIPARGFLLVWADGETNQNGMGEGDLHVPFKLGAGGEALGLFDAGGVQQHAVVFGPQVQNVSQGLLPDGETNAVHSLTNWTPRAVNLPGPVRMPDILSIVRAAGEGMQVEMSAVPAHLYRIEAADSLLSTNWIPVSTSRAAAAVTPAVDPAPSPTQRVYRAVLVP